MEFAKLNTMRRYIPLLLLFGCSAEPEPAPQKKVTPDPPKPGFVAEERGMGPAAWLTAELDADITTVEVWAELDAVFGLALHLRYDPTHLALEGNAAMEEVLGDAAFHVVQHQNGDLALGGTKRDPAGPEVDLGSPVLLSRVQFRSLRDAETKLTIERLMVRRSDGRYTEASTHGGTLTTVSGGAS